VRLLSGWPASGDAVQLNIKVGVGLVSALYATVLGLVALVVAGVVNLYAHSDLLASTIGVIAAAVVGWIWKSPDAQIAERRATELEQETAALRQRVGYLGSMQAAIDTEAKLNRLSRFGPRHGGRKR
jgi:hypothetical protein